MTLFEWQAQVTTNIGGMLAHALATTDEERLDWHPSADPQSKTRSALDQAAECIDVNRRIAALLRGETPPPPGVAWPFANAAEAPGQVRESVTELAAAMRGLDEEALARSYNTGMGPVRGTMLLQIPVLNMAYHVGQINFIQTLYGNSDFSFPPGFFDEEPTPSAT